jgi:hypothetical protein
VAQIAPKRRYQTGTQIAPYAGSGALFHVVPALIYYSCLLQRNENFLESRLRWFPGAFFKAPN